jgi:hypothetical protein
LLLAQVARAIACTIVQTCFCHRQPLKGPLSHQFSGFWINKIKNGVKRVLVSEKTGAPVCTAPQVRIGWTRLTPARLGMSAPSATRSLLDTTRVQAVRILLPQPRQKAAPRRCQPPPRLLLLRCLPMPSPSSPPHPVFHRLK